MNCCSRVLNGVLVAGILSVLIAGTSQADSVCYSIHGQGIDAMGRL